MAEKMIPVGILGTGNIGTDLMYKVKRSHYLSLILFAGIDPKSKGIALAKEEGIDTSTDGIDEILERDNIRIVFDATGAKPHLAHAPLLRKKGKIAVDLTPAAVGPYVVPCVNLDKYLDEPNVNLVTCGGQATVPIVAAINEVAKVEYAEIVATISSKSAGPGTRQNIDEFTQTTAKGLVKIGGAGKGKAIIILNPAEPPIMMHDTIYTLVENVERDLITRAVEDMISKVQAYVPGYRLKVPPNFDDRRVTVILEIEGAGDFLPKYSGNLDIMTAAATAVGEKIAQRLLDGGGSDGK